MRSQFGLPEEVGAKEFWFEAQELGKGKGPFEMGETEIWLPTAVMIDQKEDLNEPLWFVVKNPTGADHEIAVAGLFMLLPEEEVIPETKLDPGSGGLLPRSIPVSIHIKVKSRLRKTAKGDGAGFCAGVERAAIVLLVIVGGSSRLKLF